MKVIYSAWLSTVGERRNKKAGAIFSGLVRNVPEALKESLDKNDPRSYVTIWEKEEANMGAAGSDGSTPDIARNLPPSKVFVGTLVGGNSSDETLTIKVSRDFFLEGRAIMNTPIYLTTLLR